MRLSFFSLFLCLSFVLFSAPAQAQLRISTGEDVAIAFFKTGGEQPNYDTLVRGLKDYARTPLARQNAFFEKETLRLRNAYQNYDPATDLLTIRTRVEVTLHHEIIDEDTEKHSMTLFFGKDDALFFPYQLGDYNIAILPQKMDARFDRDIAPSQYALIKSSFNEQTSGTAFIYIQLKPFKSYMDEPVKMGGLDQWVLVADVTNLTLTDSKGSSMWNYSANWYVSPQTESLRELYDDQAVEKQRVMETENPLKPVQ